MGQTIQYKCSNCGGQLEFGGSISLVCPYCGSKSFLSDKDYSGNEEFRKRLLSYYKAKSESKEFDYKNDKMWRCNGTKCFTTDDGQELVVEYMKKYSYEHCDCYLASESVVYVFDNAFESQLFESGLKSLSFPAADDKLHRSFPSLKMNLHLQDDKVVLAYLRRPNLYPAELFAPFASEHLAWVISRMENICCALAYSEIEYRNISPTSIWINPFTHEGALFGDWRDTRPLKDNTDLKDLRKTAISLALDTRRPKEMYTFLNSRPAGDAFSDFALWDKVIEDGFGGHKFIKL